MLGRVAFLSGWIFGYFVHRNPLDIALVTAETSALRTEISQAREAVDQLSKGRLVCEWEVWWHKWCLRLNGIFDLLLVSWIVWTRFWSRPRPALPIQADTGGSSSSDTDEPSHGGTGVLAIKSVPAGKGPFGRGRPLRPSDFKGGK